MFGREPALILGMIQALIALGVGFGLELSSEQMGLLMAASAAVIGFWTRTKVSPVDERGNVV